MVRSVTFLWFLTIAVIAFGYVFSFLLPLSVSRENGPIENLQVLVYLVGFVQAVILAYRSRGAWRALWIGSLPIWFVLAMREVSWGKVLYPPADGAAASHIHWYDAPVGPVLGILLLVAAIAVWRGRPWTLLPAMTSQRQLPWAEILMAAICVLLMTAAEHHMGLSLDAVLGESQIFEEMVELAAALFLLTAQQRVRIAAGVDAVETPRAEPNRALH